MAALPSRSWVVTVAETRDAGGAGAWTALPPPAVPRADRWHEVEMLGLLVAILAVALVLAVALGTPPLV